MNRYEWSLDALYKGYDDPAFQNDLKQYHDLHDELSALTEEMNTLEECCAVKEVLRLLEKEYDLSGRLHMYTILRQSVDTNDKQTLRYLNIINSRISSYSVYRSQLKDYLAHIKHMDSCIQQDEMLKEYSFLLYTLKDKASHSLCKEEEAMLAKLSQTSTAAFSDMYYHLTANVSVECLGQTMTLTQVKNLCHSTSRDVRKEAFLCEMKAYESIKEPLAFSINNIKRQQLMEARMRGY